MSLKIDDKCKSNALSRVLAYQDYILGNKIGKYSTLGTPEGITQSFKTLTNEFQAVFKKDELEWQVMFLLWGLLPLFANQNSDTDKIYHDI